MALTLPAEWSDHFDLQQPFERLPHVRWLYEDDQTKGANYIIQNGTLFGWSESNCNYEFAWYWYSDSDLAKKIQIERPLPTEYME